MVRIVTPLDVLLRPEPLYPEVISITLETEGTLLNATNRVGPGQERHRGVPNTGVLLGVGTI